MLDLEELKKANREREARYREDLDIPDTITITEIRIVDDLIAELEAYREGCLRLASERLQAENERDHYKAEVERLREALEFYADTTLYGAKRVIDEETGEHYAWEWGAREVDEDQGELARQALNPAPPEVGK